MPLDNPAQDSGAPLPSATVGPVGSRSLDEFARAVLDGIGAPITSGNLTAIYAWAQAEGGDTHNRASWNPLNTTQNLPGAASVNNVGVRAYPSFDAGVAATVRTLLNGHYDNLLSAFRTGKSTASQIAQQVARSPWGTGNGVTNVLNGGRVQTGSTSLLGRNAPPVPPGVNYSAYATPSGGGSTGGGTTHSGSGGGGGGASGNGGYSNMPAWDQKEFEAGLASMGFATTFLKSDPELAKIFKQAIQGKWSDVKFENAIKASKWWKSRSATQRAFDEQRYADPTTFKRQQAVTAANLIHQAAAMGFTLTQQRADQLAWSINRNGFSSDEQQNMLAQEVHYNPKQTYGGTIGSALTDIKKLGQDYNVSLTDDTVGAWATKIAGGTATTEQYEEFIKQQAINKYPWLKDQINSGLTVSDIASPFKGEMARILEVDPNTIETDDPNVLRGLQYKDPADTKGSYATMPLYAYQQMLRQDPRWLKTNNARDSLMDVGTSILHDFGLA